eukprot:TRINITY_DN1556_c0_g1_i1.p1 TRINITY_DN1556_c0_g1~~TRINITY_DN1556_c0_g1_i1.p1  ORF type:complete len:700 (-),score=128.36 TRINITY_DN1556_c0_g1_i1:219-2318(-)
MMSTISAHSAWLVVALCLLPYVLCVMPDAQFFSGLNLDLPQLAKVKTYYNANNIPAAKDALVTYYKTRTTPKWYFDPLHPNKSAVTPDKKGADSLVMGNVENVNIPYKFPNGSDYDWFFNPTYKSDKYPYDPEWQWQFNRMDPWPVLGAAWWGLSNDSYAETWVKQMTSWVVGCPRPAQVNQSDWSAWRTIEAGIRMGGSWPDAWNRFLSSDAFSPDAVILMLKGFMDHGDYLQTFHTSGNWLTMEMNGLFTVGALFPEFSHAPSWRKFAATQLFEETRADFLPDGMWYELTTGYDQVSIGNTLALWQVASVTNCTGDVPEGYVGILQNAYRYNVKLMCPNGQLPYVNDAWPVNVAGQCQQGLPYFPDDELLQWCASNRQKGAPPPFESIWLNSSNYIALRTGWGLEDTYMLFDVAPLGARHFHQDKLNVIVDVFGRRLLYDSGGGPYEQSRYRDFAVDTPSHNTVLVDHQPQRRAGPTDADPMGSGNPKTPRPTFQTSSEFDYASGVYMDPYGTQAIATHKREVLFIKENIVSFVIVDTLTPNDSKPHVYQALWNLLTTEYAKTNLSVVTNDTGLPNMAVYPMVPGTGVQTYVAFENASSLYGWDVDRNPPFYIHALEIVHERSGAGEMQLVTFLLPLQKNQKAGVKSIVASNENQDYTIDFEDGSSIHVMLVPGGGIKAVVSKAGQVEVVMAAGVDI